MKTLNRFFQFNVLFSAIIIIVCFRIKSYVLKVKNRIVPALQFMIPFVDVTEKHTVTNVKPNV
jgi:hypothetical protein